MSSAASTDHPTPTFNIRHHKKGSIKSITDDCSALGLTEVSSDNQNITLEIPKGYALVDGTRITRKVPPDTFSGRIGFFHKKGTVPCTTNGDESTGTVIITDDVSKSVTKLGNMTVKSTAEGRSLETVEIYTMSNSGPYDSQRRERGVRLFKMRRTGGTWASGMRCWDATEGGEPRVREDFDRPVGENHEEGSAPPTENASFCSEGGPPNRCQRLRRPRHMSMTRTEADGVGPNAVFNPSLAHPSMTGEEYSNIHPPHESMNPMPSFASSVAASNSHNPIFQKELTRKLWE